MGFFWPIMADMVDWRRHGKSRDGPPSADVAISAGAALGIGPLAGGGRPGPHFHSAGAIGLWRRVYDRIQKLSTRVYGFSFCYLGGSPLWAAWSERHHFYGLGYRHHRHP